MSHQKELTYDYRKIDEECALLSDRIKNNRNYETDLLIPNVEEKEKLNTKLENIREKAKVLSEPDDVYAFLKNHFLDFLDDQQLEIQNIYKRPSRHINIFLYTFTALARKDSRKDVEKAEILIKKYSQADAIWKSIEDWLDKVSLNYLWETISNCNLFIETMEYETKHLDRYFPELSDKMIEEMTKAINGLSDKMKKWVKQTKQVIDEKKQDIQKPGSEIVVFEESYYRDLLNKVVGVDLDELLRWHEEEIQKTRESVFRIANNLKIPDPAPKRMEDITHILNKYAGPCDTPEDMLDRGRDYLRRSKEGCKEHVWLPEDDSCNLMDIPYNLRNSYPWGGYFGGCFKARPLKGNMFLNNFNHKAVTDGWIKMNTVHEAYPGHHVQFVRTTLDPIPETMKIGSRSTPITEGTFHRSEKVFEFIFEEDQFYPLFVAYRRHHTAVRIKADLMLRYFGNPIDDVVKLYMDELGFDVKTSRGQVKAQELMEGYFTSYYYGFKKIDEWEKELGFEEKEYTELLFSAGRISMNSLNKFLRMDASNRQRILTGFPSLMQFD
jgi:hypothetical protein